jgi:hypothetical protein
MGVNIKQNADGSAGLQGVDLDDGPITILVFNYNSLLTSLTQTVGVMQRKMVVKAIYHRPDVVSSNAVTATLYNTPNGTAPSGGVALHTGSCNLQGTVNTNVELTLVAAAAPILADSAIGVIISGAVGAVGAGSISVHLCPA